MTNGRLLAVGPGPGRILGRTPLIGSANP